MAGFSSENYIPRMLSLAVHSVKTSAKVPSGEDYAFECADSSIRNQLNELSSSIEDLLGQLTSFVNPGFDPADLEESVFEGADKCLENVEIMMDSPDQPKPVHSLNPHDLAKPQAHFLKDLDNSSGYFVPKLTYKPHAKVPLELACGQEGYPHPYLYEIEHFSITPEQCQPAADPTVALLEDTPYVYVDSADKFHQFLQDLSSQREIAVDLEHHSLRTYQGFLCLLQVSTRTTDYIVDVFLVWECMPELLPIFTDPGIVKVFHGAGSDIVWLQRDFGLYVVNLFDTHQAAKLLQFERLSLAYLLDTLCNVQSDKRYQRSDWRLRPLTEEHLKYARMDTHYLLYIYDVLRMALIEKAGRLGCEPYELIAKVIQESREVCKRKYEKPELKYTGLKHCTELLTNEQRRVLESVLTWRDDLARLLDENPSFIMPGKLAVTLAVHPAKTVEELKSMTNPRFKILLSNAESLIAVLANAGSDVQVVPSPFQRITQPVNPIPATPSLKLPAVSLTKMTWPNSSNKLFACSPVPASEVHLKILSSLPSFFSDLYTLYQETPEPSHSSVPNVPPSVPMSETVIPLSVREEYDIGKKKRLPAGQRVQVNSEKKHKLTTHNFKKIGWLDNIELAPVKRKDLFKKKRR